MYDTYITIVGNVLTAPEWRRTRNTNALVANFKLASTSRRFDKAANRWVDGDSLRVRVTCWRRLAEGVCSSIMVGDPVVVLGRMYTRDWIGENEEKRTAYELEAIAVGHDLSKGQAKFERKRLNTATTAIEDAEAESRIGGEPTEQVNHLDGSRLAGTAEGSDVFDDEAYAEELALSAQMETEVDAVAAFREAGLAPERVDPEQVGVAGAGAGEVDPASQADPTEGNPVSTSEGDGHRGESEPEPEPGSETGSRVEGGPGVGAENGEAGTGATAARGGRGRRGTRQPVSV